MLQRENLLPQSQLSVLTPISVAASTIPVILPKLQAADYSWNTHASSHYEPPCFSFVNCYCFGFTIKVDRFMPRASVRSHASARHRYFSWSPVSHRTRGGYNKNRNFKEYSFTDRHVSRPGKAVRASPWLGPVGVSREGRVECTVWSACSLRLECRVCRPVVCWQAASASANMHTGETFIVSLSEPSLQVAAIIIIMNT